MTTTEQRRLIAANQQRLDAHHARVPSPKPTASPLPARALRGGDGVVRAIRGGLGR